MLRYDGLYCSPVMEEATDAGTLSYRDYLRFYADGNLLAVVSTGNPAQVARWFHKGSQQLSEGVYRLDGTSLSFSTSSPGGEVRKDEEFYGGHSRLW